MKPVCGPPKPGVTPGALRVNCVCASAAEAAVDRCLVVPTGGVGCRSRLHQSHCPRVGEHDGVPFLRIRTKFADFLADASRHFGASFRCCTSVMRRMSGLLFGDEDVLEE